MQRNTEKDQKQILSESLPDKPQDIKPIYKQKLSSAEESFFMGFHEYVVDQDQLEIPKFSTLRIFNNIKREVLPSTMNTLKDKVRVALYMPSPVAELSREAVRHEAHLLKKLQSKYVAEMIAVSEVAGYFAIVTPIYLENLREFLAKPLSLKQKITLARDICRGLQHIHDQGCIYGVLPIFNIRVDDNGKIKIADFTFVHSFKNNTRIEGEDKKKYEWLAPELLNSNVTTKAADVYSVGVILHELFTGMKPFENCTLYTIINLKKQPKHLPFPPNGCPKSIQKLIEACCSHDPKNRPTAQSLGDTFDTLLNLSEYEIQTLAKRPPPFFDKKLATNMNNQNQKQQETVICSNCLIL